MKVYNTQGHSDFGFHPSSSIPKPREHGVSETGAVSYVKWGEGDTYSFGSFRKS
jgi:hypothetical protein